MHLGKQLIDHSIPDTSSACCPSTSLLADSIELIKYDDMQATLIALGFVLGY
jgi:hypothetical protein